MSECARKKAARIILRGQLQALEDAGLVVLSRTELSQLRTALKELAHDAEFAVRVTNSYALRSSLKFARLVLSCADYEDAHQPERSATTTPSMAIQPKDCRP